MEEAGVADDVVLAAFQAAGLNPAVVLRLDSIRFDSVALAVGATLLYSLTNPVCCAEPSCYIPALRPAGLLRVAEHVWAACNRRDRLLMTVALTLSVPEGFAFRLPEPVSAGPLTRIYMLPEIRHVERVLHS